jgi:pimeloyl-ACP methyl ester carboxylesterase
VIKRIAIILGVTLIGGAVLTAVAFERSGHGVPAQHNTGSRLSLEPCALPGLTGESLCGTYEVFEDRAAKSGRTIKLRIVVLKALGRSPAPDAIFALHGGPGAAATQLIGLAYGGILAPSRQDHDLVFIDQRGTGGSGALMCDVGDNPQDLATFFGDIFPRDKVRACRQKLEGNADLRLYTTPIAMDDLDEVRAALGYEKIDLLGLSYGSFAAQIYMRRHPDHVHLAFLLGVATPDIKQPLLFPRSAQHAMDLLFIDCASDELCHSSFPNLQKEFDAVLARFDHGPVAMELINPGTGKKEQVKVARSSFVEHIRRAMYATGTQRFVPFIIHRAFANDYLPFEEAAVQQNRGSRAALGMYFTVTCSEGVRFITDLDVVKETQGTFVGPDRVKRHMEACQEWPKGDIPPSYIDPIQSDAPVLMISGEVDGASSPGYGERALKFLPNGRQLKIRYLGHQSDSPCLRDIFQNFIAAGSAKGLNTTCTEAIRRPPFATELPPQFRLD